MPTKIKNWQKLKEILRISLSLAKANFLLRIENNRLGVLWYLLNPLALFLVLFLVKKAAFNDVYIAFYPLYLLLGISGFNFLKQALNSAIEVINDNPEYLKSISNLKPESLILSSVLQSTFSHIFELLLIIILAIVVKAPLIGFLLYPLNFLIFFIGIIGISFILGVISVYINDIKNIWLIASQLILLGTPIFYKVSPDTLIYKANLFNPLFYFIEISRDIIINKGIHNWSFFITFCLISIALFILGLMVFKRYKKKLPELL